MKKNDNPKLKFIEPRKDTKHLHFKIEDRDNRKKREINKLIKFQKYVNQKKCREQMLLNYFGEVSESQCGRCDICRNFN